jgi:hypothetical protein
MPGNGESLKSWCFHSSPGSPSSRSRSPTNQDPIRSSTDTSLSMRRRTKPAALTGTDMSQVGGHYGRPLPPIDFSFTCWGMFAIRGRPRWTMA